ncbi:MAG: DUF1566 domain-containing protein [bacterium]
MLSSSVFAAGRFVIKNKETVTDTKTGLMWEQRPHEVGQGTITWNQAVKYCKELALGGHDDWRLPSLKELESLYDKSLNPPRLNEDEAPFDDIETFWFWSSTIYAKNNTDNYPWVVYPTIGFKLCNYDKTFAGNVLAVRDAR